MSVRNSLRPICFPFRHARSPSADLQPVQNPKQTVSQQNSAQRHAGLQPDTTIEQAVSQQCRRNQQQYQTGKVRGRRSSADVPVP